VKRKLYIVMVGLPAMGKSTIAHKLCRNLEQEGLDARIFNNGDLRRSLLDMDTSRPEFYDPRNREGASIREKIAIANLEAARSYLRHGGKVAIVDATNASRGRRRTIMRTLSDHPLLFVECLNQDQDLILTSIEQKAKMAEFRGLSLDEAVASFQRRIEYYRSIYVALEEEPNFVVIDSLHHQILREKLEEEPPHYQLIRDLLITDWIRNLFLVRHGETYYNTEDRVGGDSRLTRKGLEQSRQMAEHFASQDIPHIFTSTKERTRQMGALIARRQRDARVFQLPELDEIDSGICEGMSYEEIRTLHPEVYQARQREKYHYVYPGGESYAMLHQRVGKGLKKALYICGNAERLMIVGHRAVNRTILSHFLYRPTQDVPYIYVPQDRYFHIISTQTVKHIELMRYT
jgi:broad specificity phosphatase PhoE/predicted kinase